MKYKRVSLDDSLIIDGVYSVHYFEYMRDYVFRGESHPFWELVYADKKGLLLTAGDREITLKSGQLFIHRPDEFHTLRCTDGAANSVIFSFGSDCERLYDIAGQVIVCGAEERKILGNIIAEATMVFATPLGEMSSSKLVKAEDAAYGGEQLIKTYIEQLLILLIRGKDQPVRVTRYENSRLLKQICEYLEKNVESKLRFEDVLGHFNVSASVVKKIFRENMDCGIMEYFNRLKVEAAKQMIREESYNFTEIADKLAFNTSQYFTTVFRRVTGMTPSEYEASVKSKYTVGRNKI
ncbi:MAG: helix-turn-helix transcriptional regulator [Clostridia bacterium]|nr:helix-turn-helix transcriptional regulator [Clostridia bacterium]